MSTKFSPSFSKEEFELHGSMPAESAFVCSKMCNLFLEKLRTQFGKPFIITSGHRPPEDNLATGGVPKSEHIYTQDHCACDGYFESHHQDMRPVFDWIRTQSGLSWDQVILEHGEGGDIIHIGYSLTKARREAKEGKTHGESKVYETHEVVPMAISA